MGDKACCTSFQGSSIRCGCRAWQSVTSVQDSGWLRYIQWTEMFFSMWKNVENPPLVRESGLAFIPLYSPASRRTVRNREGFSGHENGSCLVDDGCYSPGSEPPESPDGNLQSTQSSAVSRFLRCLSAAEKGCITQSLVFECWPVRKISPHLQRKNGLKWRRRGWRLKEWEQGKKGKLSELQRVW